MARAIKKILEGIFKRKTADALFPSIVNRRTVDSIEDINSIAVGN